MINLWHTSELNVRLSSQNIKQISDTLENMKHNVPLEFQRKPRSLLYFRQWKGTEFRHLLNYTGPVVFKNVLRSDVYNNYLTLNIAMTILSSEIHCKNSEFINYARKLLSHFVTSFKSLYGSHNVSYNVHWLLHLVDDVEKFGPLDNFSAYRFENYLGKLKKKNRKDDKPLQQIARRYTEIENNLKIDGLKIINNNEIKYKKEHSEGPLFDEFIFCTQFKEAYFYNFTLKVDDINNNCVGIKENVIALIKNIVYNNKTKQYFLIGKEYSEKQALYTVPCNSSILNIFELNNLSNNYKMWPISSVICKYFVYNIPGTNSTAAFPILHTEKNEHY